MEVNIKPQPKKKGSQERLDEALGAIGDITESLEYRTWTPTKTYPKPIFAGGFSRDMRLGLDFDDIDIYVPHGFGCKGFLRHFEDVTLLTPVKTAEELAVEKQELEDLEDLLIKEVADGVENAYEELCEITSGVTKYKPSEGGLKLVWSFTFKGFKFNLMLMDKIEGEEPTQRLFEKQVMDSFNCCLARTYLRLEGSQVFYPEFELAVETKRMYITRVNLSAKYLNKMIKYFPDYEVLIAEPVENLYEEK